MDRIAPVVQVAQHRELKPALCIPQAAMRCAPRRQGEKNGPNSSKPRRKGGDRYLDDDERMALLEFAVRLQGCILIRKYQQIQFVSLREVVDDRSKPQGNAIPAYRPGHDRQYKQQSCLTSSLRFMKPAPAIPPLQGS